MRILKHIAVGLVLIFAFIGLLFSSVFVAMQFGLLNVRGSIEARNNSILSVDTNGSDATDGKPMQVDQTTGTSTEGQMLVADSCDDGHITCRWAETREWEVVAGGLTKDLAVIDRVAAETDVSPRLIAAVVVPEQIRFFTANREVFKRYFEPLKILGSLSKFSLGVSGIKQETAVRIEEHAKDPNSPFYPGDGYAALLSYETSGDHSQELYNRLTDEKDHYYSYLYTAVFIKEILAQWERAGYDLSDRPEIVATIFNIGFGASRPNTDPKVGGTPITVGGFDYTFGELAGLFYRSSQLPALSR